jgi:hypothetical protein
MHSFSSDTAPFSSIFIETYTHSQFRDSFPILSILFHISIHEAKYFRNNCYTVIKSTERERERERERFFLSELTAMRKNVHLNSYVLSKNTFHHIRFVPMFFFFSFQQVHLVHPGQMKIVNLHMNLRKGAVQTL